ncbi:HEAT repeat domain-containing protein [Candidatus Riflebacteria bacterium]
MKSDFLDQRIHAAEKLAGYTYPASILALSEGVESNFNAAFCITAAESLAKISTPMAIGALEAAIVNNCAVHSSVASILGQMGTDASIDALIRILATADYHLTRFTAAAALSEVKTDASCLALIKALEDSDEMVREQAAGSLKYVGDSRAFPALEKMIKTDKGRGGAEKAKETLDYLKD